ncbi:MAG: endonuclease/exonuclease/phosphatase family protein, partial [Vicinamibacterales bacterium]
ELVVATLNIRNRADRWRERAGLLIEQFIELQPDVIGLQEIRRPFRQGEWLRREVNRRLPPGAPPYAIVHVWKSGLRRFWEGVAVMTRLPVVSTARLDLGGGSRVAQRVGVRLPSGGVLDFVNTHLHHEQDEDALRLAQVRRIVGWLEQAEGMPRILVGDFNSEPDSSVVGAVLSTMRSAYFDAHDAEPDWTSPTLLNRRDDSQTATIDYIFVSQQVTVADAWLDFTRAAPDDERLYASDHYGLAARILIQPPT